MTTEPDCHTCGACCCSPNHGQEWHDHWIPVREEHELVRIGKELLKTGVSWDGRYNNYHMRMVGDRCCALTGKVGKEVSCEIYDKRPDVCQKYEPGTSHCLAVRRIRGVT